MADKIEFEKWHGTGNDFVMVSEQMALAFTSHIPDLAKKMCRRHFGVGSDGLILVGKSESAGFRMKMWNPDGSEAEMCGNGLRCVASHLKLHGLTDGKSDLKIETGKGILDVSFPSRPAWAVDGDDWVKIDMGEPVLDPESIPIRGDFNTPVVNFPLMIPGTSIGVSCTAVNMGNPHAVIFVGNINSVPLETWGPAIENHISMFPDRVNVEFVQVLKSNHVRMRVWERGAGITLSCGTGTAAVQAACRLTGNAGDLLRVDVPGGSLQTEWTSDDRISLTGPAVMVYKGEWISKTRSVFQ